MDPARIPHSRYGSALIVSGPSGAGKTTVCRQLQQLMPELHFSVSCTTRPPRAGEEDGADYHFLGAADFRRRIQAGELLEWAEVHDNLYGTLRSEVEERVKGGKDVLLDVDVQGARQIRAATAGTLLERCVVFVFFAPPSVAELERRLRGRRSDSADAIATRLHNAQGEMTAWREYDYLVVNRDGAPEETAAALAAILQASRLRTTRIPDDAEGDVEP